MDEPAQPERERIDLETTLLSAGPGALAAGVLWDSAPFAIAGATGILYSGALRIAGSTKPDHSNNYRSNTYRPMDEQE